MRDVSITTKITLDGKIHVLEYESAIDAARDTGTRCLFDDRLITACTIERQGKRLAGMPRMTWEAYESALDRLVR